MTFVLVLHRSEAALPGLVIRVLLCLPKNEICIKFLSNFPTVGLEKRKGEFSGVTGRKCLACG